MELTVEKIYFTYPESGNSEPVLKGINASFFQGAITAVTGANGCGKTTLVKNITGILRPDPGCIRLWQESVEQDEPSRNRTRNWLFAQTRPASFLPDGRRRDSFGLRKQGLGDRN